MDITISKSNKCLVCSNSLKSTLAKDVLHVALNNTVRRIKKEICVDIPMEVLEGILNSYFKHLGIEFKDSDFSEAYHGVYYDLRSLTIYSLSSQSLNATINRVPLDCLGMPDLTLFNRSELLKAISYDLRNQIL